MRQPILFGRGPVNDASEMQNDDQAKALSLALHLAAAIGAFAGLVVADPERADAASRAVSIFHELVRNTMTLYKGADAAQESIVLVAEGLGLELLQIPEAEVLQ